jgi:hypothetical protein
MELISELMIAAADITVALIVAISLPKGKTTEI